MKNMKKILLAVFAITLMLNMHMNAFAMEYFVGIKWEDDCSSAKAMFASTDEGVSSQREVDCDIESTTTATCTTGGITTYTATCYYGGTICSDKKTVEVSALGHQWRTSYSNDETKHWYECTRAGCTAKMDEEKHSFETIVDVEASCEYKGSQHEVCTLCGYKKPSVTIQKKAHSLKEVERKDATCTEAGYEAYWKCKTCEGLFSDAAGTKAIKEPVELAALKHDYSTSYSNDETKHWRECTREGCTAKENEEEHSFETVVDVEASCENKGSQHEECTTCHYKKTSVEISATGHALEKVAKKNASCTEAGYEAYWKCKTCGKLFSDEAGTAAIEKPVEISATGHTWKDGKCTVCGEKQPVTKENTSSSKTGKNTSSPKTGDTQEIVYIWMTLLVSVAGLTGVILKRKSER